MNQTQQKEFYETARLGSKIEVKCRVAYRRFLRPTVEKALNLSGYICSLNPGYVGISLEDPFIEEGLMMREVDLCDVVDSNFLEEQS